MHVDICVSWVPCQLESTARVLEKITRVLQLDTAGGRQTTAVTNRHRPATPGHHVTRMILLDVYTYNIIKTNR